MHKPTEQQAECVEAVKSHDTNILKIEACAGAGKEQPVSTVVQTPSGPRYLGDICVGDLVLGQNGKPTKVIGVFPQGMKDVYKVTFRDGSSTRCGIEHLWTVTNTGKKGDVHKTLSLKQIVEKGVKRPSGDYRYKIPLCQPVEYTACAQHFIHPYILGVLIGDGYMGGSTTQVSVADRDRDILSKMEKLLPPNASFKGKRTGDNCVQYIFLDASKIGADNIQNSNRITAEVRRLGLDVLSGEKFIPKEYLHTSVDNRIALLQGLMDSDGCCSNNRTSFHTKSENLVRDLKTLVQSLGGTAIVRTSVREGSIEYSVNVKTFFNPFTTKFKAERWKPSKKNPPSRYLTKVEKVGIEEQVCIKVDAEDQLYLTDEFIVTHNTSTLTMMAEAVEAPSLYLAFNKVTADEASLKFPRHVVCKTTHSMAYAAYGAKIREKLSRPKGKYVNVAGTGGEIGRFYKLDAIELDEDTTLSQAFLGLLAKMTVQNFEQSADKELSREHLPWGELAKIAKKTTASMAYTQETILKTARKLWKDRTNHNSPVLATHDTYLKMYQLSKPIFHGTKVLYVDEFQDTTPCVLDIVMNQREHMKIVVVGDSRQAIYCQPAGTLVKVCTSKFKRNNPTQYEDIPIENLKVGDKVLSYSVGMGHLYKNGKEITKIGSREYHGCVVDVAVGNTKSTYTADHEVLVRLGNYNVGKQVVYMMQKGRSFRIGVAPWKYKGGLFGAAQRAGAEKADAMWVLGVYPTVREALTYENIYSYKFGIPQVCFQDRSKHEGQVDATQFWTEYGENFTNGLVALNAMGLDINSPLWRSSTSTEWVHTKMRSSFVTKACNLLDGMLCADLSEEDISQISSHGRLSLEYWKPIKVTKRYTKETVYSLEVADAHTYFGDGILTHNCWRGAINALSKIDAPTFHLTKSFRYGQAIADIATMVLEGAMKIDGNEAITSVAGLNCVDTTKPYTRLFRTNTALLTAAIGELRMGTEIAIEVDIKDFVKLLESTLALYRGEMKAVKHEKLLAYETWYNLRDEAKFDPELGRMVKIVDSGEAEAWIELLECHTNSKTPHVTFTTSHKGKGREWRQVRIESDFKSCYGEEGWVGLSEEEQNLLYVACTRAIEVLEYNQTVAEYIEHYNNVRDAYMECVTKQLKREDRLIQEIIVA